MQLPIFDTDPIESALQSPDAWLKKLPVEVCQMLATCYTTDELANAPLTAKGTVRSNKSHPHHPIVKWVQASQANFIWAWEYAYAAIIEAFERGIIKKAHHMLFLDWVLDNLPTFPQQTCTEFVKPKGYEYLSIVDSYRTYFLDNKLHLAQWSNRDVPEWFIAGITELYADEIPYDYLNGDAGTVEEWWVNRY